MQWPVSVPDLVLGRREARLAGGVEHEADGEAVLALQVVAVRGDPRGPRGAEVGVGGGVVAHVHLVRLDPGERDVGEDEHLEVVAAGPAGLPLARGLVVVAADDSALLGGLGLVDVVLRDDPAQAGDLGDVRVLGTGGEDEEEGQGLHDGLLGPARMRRFGL